MGEILRSSLKSTLASEELGWAPLTSLEDGLSETLDWFATNAPTD
jgi:nucleoside-diphosphate-sugar epimerase